MGMKPRATKYEESFLSSIRIEFLVEMAGMIEKEE